MHSEWLNTFKMFYKFYNQQVNTCSSLVQSRWESITWTADDPVTSSVYSELT